MNRIHSVIQQVVLRRFFGLCALCATALLPTVALADADPSTWGYLQSAFFDNREITEVEFLKIEGPRRAESGAQVPITIFYDRKAAHGVLLKNIRLLIDGNPIPLAATYHLNETTQGLELSTRIRMEADSFVRIVGEAADGKLYMAKREIRASGGCSGPVNSANPEASLSVGTMRLKVNGTNFEQPVTVSLNIRHPMHTGLQRELMSPGFVPAYYIQKLTMRYNDLPVLNVDVGISVSEDPYFQFKFVPSASGTLEIEAVDNQQKRFTHTKRVDQL